MKKRCRHCLRLRPLDDFHRNKAMGDGHQSYCKQCHHAKNMKWLHENHLRESPKRAAYSKEYYKANKEVITAKAHVYYRENYATFYKKMIERYEHVKRATPPWADKKAIKAIYKKAYAMRKRGLNVEVDHIYPLKGKTSWGLHIAANLRIVTRAENKAKHNKMLTEKDLT